MKFSLALDRGLGSWGVLVTLVVCRASHDGRQEMAIIAMASPEATSSQTHRRRASLASADVAWREHLTELVRTNPATLVGHARSLGNARVRLGRRAELGPWVRLWGRPVIDNCGTLRIGEAARLVSTVVPLELSVGESAVLEIGERAFINYGTSIGATERVVIGAHARIGTYVIIMDNDFHRLEPERRDEVPPSAPVTIGDNVWLGARVIVLSGVTIGAGSVVAAGSVVTKDVPPRSLAAGMPARVIRQL